MGQSKRQRRKNRSKIQASATPAARLGLTCPVTISAADGEASAPRRFKMVAYTGEPMRLYGYEDPVVVDCATIDLKGQRLPALLDHMAYEMSIVGQIERVTVEGANGTPPVVAEGYFTPTDEERDAARLVLKKADAGYQWQASIGGDPGKVEKIAAGQSVNVNGRTYAGPVCVARNVALREISFVVLGADRLTSAVLARKQGGKPMNFEAWLKAKGYDPTAITAKLKKTLRAAFKAEAVTDEEEETPAAEASEMDEDEEVEASETEVEEVEEPTNAAARRPSLRATRHQLAAEEERVGMIRSRASASGISEIQIGDGAGARRVNLVAHAIREGWDANAVDLAILRAERGTGPAVIVRAQDRESTISALQASMIVRAGGRLDHPVFNTPRGMHLPAWLRANINADVRQRAMEASHRYRNLSAIDLARECVRLDGGSVPHDRDEMLRAAFSSGGSLTNVFTTNVNAILLMSYSEVNDTTVGWCSEAEVGDFKTQERIRVEVGTGLKKLPRGGEADHGKYGDKLESYRIARYAKQFVMDDQDMIDDNFSVFSESPKRFGQEAAWLRPDLVYAHLMSNPTLAATARELFNTTDGNLKTTAALAADKLKAAVSAMRLFREASRNLNIQPTHLIVPSTLEFTGFELLNSAENIVAGTTDVARGNVNPLQRLGLTLVSEARLENGVTDPATETAYSGSASTWYLASNAVNTIEVGYLRGTGRAPQVRSFVLDRGKWGVGWDVKMDIGVKALDYRGFVKNTQ